MFNYDILAESDDYMRHPILAELVEDKPLYYFVAGHSVTGARFYSPQVDTYAEARKEYDKIHATVEYFGGGSIELYAITNLDFYVLAYDYIAQ